jgi:hypothetical protein
MTNNLSRQLGGNSYEFRNFTSCQEPPALSGNPVRFQRKSASKYVIEQKGLFTSTNLNQEENSNSMSAVQVYNYDKQHKAGQNERVLYLTAGMSGRLLYTIYAHPS